MTPNDAYKRAYNKAYSERRIDQLLRAFAATPAPAGLEQRVSARLAQRAEETESRKPLLPLRVAFTTQRPLATATAASMLLAATCLLFVLHTRQPQVAQQRSTVVVSARQPQSATAARPKYRSSVLRRRLHTVSTASAQDDPDAIALAETLAPSHAEQLLPLTAQEALLLRSTRPGEPLEVAELETRRDSVLAAIAETRERFRIREYVHGLLGPLATAQALTPAPSTQDDPQTVANAEPTSSQ